MLYDLTSTYFESDPPQDENDKRRYGYSRDKRSDCVQVLIALIVTPEGLPLAYEVLAGNTLDKTTLREFLHKIETQYGVISGFKMEKDSGLKIHRGGARYLYFREPEGGSTGGDQSGGMDGHT